MNAIWFGDSVREETSLFSDHANGPAHCAVSSMDPPSRCIGIPKHDLDARPAVAAAGATSVLDIHLTAVVVVIKRVYTSLDVVVQLASREAFVRT